MDKFVTQSKQTCATNDDTTTQQKAKGPSDISQYPGDGPCRPVLKTYPSRMIGGRSRAFVATWYDNYDWLEYSASEDATYCFPCRHFRRETGGSIKIVYTEEGFSNWKKAIESLKSHETSLVHKHAMEQWAEFKIRKKSSSKILKAMNVGHDKLVLENRHYIKALIECLIYTCCQNIAQRGHDESENSENKGNFIELLAVVGKFDVIVDKKLQSISGNAKYTSPEIKTK